ncbi:hypothetical protein [Pseudoalteromonas sp. McH1-42]|uniref:hypothetical protein n=1 Tax=Pseudoalteromonas sp. McH1-42 TaxID=2917752 RepID=UPI001EF438EE|nr:hypothetical protein [Pseudoalteromonas sp. McH1-42]MCG7561025.1 hypothetical protein [Pseudoalteromonas sp. McH1-42]
MNDEKSKKLRDAANLGPRAPTYSDNPHAEDSDAFDLYERKVTQRIKRMENVKCESYPIGEEPVYGHYGELKGSKFVKEKKPVKTNGYAAAKMK